MDRSDERGKESGQIDAPRLAVIGHSRLGKTALWAGAQDPNLAMVVSNNSGCGGAAVYRRCYGERLHHMLRPVGYWFRKKHAEYAHRESKLPVDQHMLLALMAPRPFYIASAVDDRWSDQCIGRRPDNSEQRKNGCHSAMPQYARVCGIV